jgi:hypothetical protein
MLPVEVQQYFLHWVRPERVLQLQELVRQRRSRQL